MLKIYYYPSAPRSGYKNPYSENYKKALDKYFCVLDNDSQARYTAMFSFLKYAFLADVFVLNWVEDVAYAKLHRFKFLIVCLSLLFIRLRRKKIVWMLHNIHPHKGTTPITSFVQHYLFKHSFLIVAHSKAAADYARENTDKKVCYMCHPFTEIETKPFVISDSSYDVLIWGEILPYKGVVEFLSLPFAHNFRIKVIGRCRDFELDKKIKSLCSETIEYENRKISFDELKSLMENVRYVLFPYVGDCVSSSGALIDTLTLGGCVIGPNIGAFKDLAEEGICFTYNTSDELLGLLHKDNVVSTYLINRFMEKNSWNNLAKFIKEEV